MQNLSASVLVVDSAVNDAKYAPKMHLMSDLVNYTFLVKLMIIRLQHHGLMPLFGLGSYILK